MKRADCGCPEGTDGEPIHIPGCSETLDTDPEEAFSHWPMHQDDEKEE